jgi:hypothetical protein
MALRHHVLKQRLPLVSPALSLVSPIPIQTFLVRASHVFVQQASKLRLVAAPRMSLANWLRIFTTVRLVDLSLC